MSEWWTYRPSDFLLFSPQTYYRLFELYNTQIWPLQILTLACGVTILVLVRYNPPWQGRVIAAILATIWLWVAWAYHLQRYASINWAANYFAIGFAIEAALLIWIGIIKDHLVFLAAKSTLKNTGLGIFLFALFIQPLLGAVAGRGWLQSEIFGVAPDPTAVATLGIILLTTKKFYGLLLLIPFLWCAISGTILFTMDSPDALVLPIVAILALFLALRKAN